MATNITQNNIVVFRGDDFALKLVFADEDGVAINITNWELFFTIKKKKTDSDDDAIISKNITAFSNPTGGEASIVLTDTETDNLLGTYFYDIQYKDNNGIVQTVTSGGITFEQDITRRTT